MALYPLQIIYNRSFGKGYADFISMLIFSHIYHAPLPIKSSFVLAVNDVMAFSSLGGAAGDL